MKKILTVYTGGTICSAPDGEKRSLNTCVAKRALLCSFAESKSKYARMCADIFEDSNLPDSDQTLSENMTLVKLGRIIEHIKSFDLEKYSGVIVLHGTDTLAFSASLLAYTMCSAPVPIMLVSANKPPMNPDSNACANFSAAVELIMAGIAPNVYVPYRNSDNIMYVHLGTTLMQCANFSDDFFSSSKENCIAYKGKRTLKKVIDKFASISAKRNITYFAGKTFSPDKLGGVLLIHPYTGLDYARISLDGIKAVIHGSYHSKTVCAERNNSNAPYSSNSIIHFGDICKNHNTLLFIAPGSLSKDQYSSAFDTQKNTNAIFLDTSVESAYSKALSILSHGMEYSELMLVMQKEINGEFRS